MKIYFSESFKKSYKKRVLNDKKLLIQFKKRYQLFKHNPENPLLKDHKLKGSKLGLRSFSVSGDVRIVYSIKDRTVYFLDIGTHNQVY